MPGRITLAASLLVLGTSAALSAPLQLHRGVNVHDLLNWSPLNADGSYRQPPYRTVDEWLSEYRPLSDWPGGDEFVRIRALGFDFVRMTVDPGPLLADGGVQRDAALAVLKDRVSLALTAGLRVVLNLHGNSQVPAYSMAVVNAPASDPGIANYHRMGADVAAMLAPLGLDRVAFEPFNEPAHYPCDSTGTEDWQQIMSGQVAAVRAVAPELTVVVTGACGGSITGLTDIDPAFDDPNLLYSFHMYEPHVFTHQRLDGTDDFASGLPWPASSGSPETVVANLRAHMSAAGLGEAAQARNLALVGGEIDAYFARDWGPEDVTARIGEAVTWANQHDIPTSRLFMGEFGVILMSPDGRMGAFDADRLRYIAAVRQTAEAHDIPWGIWEYSSPYGMSVIFPTGPALPDRPLLKALGLSQ
ncbi:glycoside hydrolase family 5 protein [Devosia sp.]|uniref:glycoside hydrolase family 5 protein n=1 Tax=Devosia sp. TaxID=1871048 RepID=UPI003A9350B0